MSSLIDQPAVVLRIGQKWRPDMDEDDVYDTARGWWLIGPRREKCEYAIAVAKGVVRGVYRIHGWQERPQGEGRPGGRVKWGFDGEPAPKLHYLVGRNVSHLFTFGAANPVLYLNC